MPAKGIELMNLVQEVQCKFKGKVNIEEDSNHIGLVVEKEILPEVMAELKQAYGFDFLSDLTAVDYQDNLTVVYHLFSMETGYLLRVKTQLKDMTNLMVPTMYHLWNAADWMERETYDMFGIVFSGHPNMKRLLTDKNFKGHPLRKDFVNRNTFQSYDPSTEV